MKVHPAIAALRGPLTPQPRTAEGFDASLASHNADAIRKIRHGWLQELEVRTIIEELTAYSRGTLLADCPRLLEVVSDHGAARGFVDRLCDVMMAATRERWLCEVPFRFKTSRGLSTMQLIDAGTAKLSITAYEPMPDMKAPRTVLFADFDAHEIVISGEASGVMHRLHGVGTLQSAAQHWKAGDVIETAARVEARQVIAVNQSLLVLQLTREPAAPQPTVQVSLADGAVIRTASGDKSASQALMAISVLGALGARSALNVMGDTALNTDEDRDVRWEAVRQMLALDGRIGLGLLADLERRPGDALATPAQALKAQLLAYQPQLHDFAMEPA